MVLVTLPEKIISPEIKFPILRLPYFASRNVLLRLRLDDLIPFSFLSKRCKRMIKQAIPSKIAQYECTVKSKKLTSIDLKFDTFWLNSGAKVDDIVTSISIDSQFGHFWMGIEANVHHIIEVLSYPPIRVELYAENGVTRAAEWLKRYRNCVKSVSFSASPKDIRMHTVFVDRSTEFNNQTKYCMKFLPALRYPEVISEFVNLLRELNVRIAFGETMAVTCSTEEVRIENLNIFPISFVWSLKCQKLRIVDSILPIVMAHKLISSWALSDICASSTIKKLIFELKESEKIEERILEDGWKKSGEELHYPIFEEINAWWYKRKGGNDRTEAILFEARHDRERLENRWVKSEDDLQYPIYGKIHQHYKMYHESRKVILFETHHDGKKLLVVDFEQYGLDV
ncbi:hypothetical protein CAEBREN_17393 [Caenorhabditis brenneri]|uniref:F-box domain-containing protein n=1 Tax=Caenorhabditis brenneri TaxID=135651 RepID=G0NVN8_CAEBE|nr:hypothetical protein CAEBREN_17393 [Caenorhabditis brenneri]